MLSVTAVVSTYCFVESPSGLAQVVWLDIESSDDEEVEAWAEGTRIACPVRWRGRVAAGTTQRAEIAVLVPEGAGDGDRLPVEAIARGAGPDEARRQAELEVREPGWTMYMVSHFHYDPVWWNTQAGYTSGWDDLIWAQDRRDTFQHSGLVLVEAHMERARLDPDYKFVLAEVDYLKPFWDLYPDRREELRRLVAEGRLEIVGGTYNEPNTNLTGYETAARCAVYGMGFQHDVFGAAPESAWQLDVFAHDPSFPSLMASSGVTSSSWARGPFHQWGPKHHTGSTTWMQFPSEFEWLSPDGKSLLTSYMPDHYSAGWQLDLASTLEEAIRRAYDLFCDLAAVSATKATLLPVGTDYTPPNKWVTQLAREWSRRYAWPRFIAGLPKEFFAAVKAELAAAGRSPSPQTREMGPVYTGKDVSFIDTKQANRQAETALVEAEKLASMALALGHRYPERATDKAWRQLVFNAHHDGITGSESDQVYLDLLGGWREAYELAASVRTSAMKAIASHIDTGTGGRRLIVFNSLAHSRSEVVAAVVDVPERGARSVTVRDDAGNEVPAVVSPVAFHPDGTVSAARAEFLAAEVPGLGYRCYYVERTGQAPAGWALIEGTTVSNEHVLLEADPARGGCLSRFANRHTSREVLKDGEVGNELLVYPEYPAHPKMQEGPWHILPSGAPVRSSSNPAHVRAERSDLGERLVVEGSVDGMSYTQVVTVHRCSSRVALRTFLRGFSGVDRLVRLRFPVAVQGATPLAEVGNAVVARSFAFVNVDSADAPWTLDTPVQGWAGAGCTLSVTLAQDGRPWGSRALGVAEVVLPAGAGEDLRAGARSLLIALAAKGVTASCTEAGSNRYGGLVGDSNLPDVRISVGRPEDNALTAAVVAGAGPELGAELQRQLQDRGAARVWAPAAKPDEEVWVPNADVRGARDLPVLVVAGADTAGVERELAAIVGEVQSERLTVDQAPDLFGSGLSGPGFGGPGRAADSTVAILNRGTPGFAVGPDGSIYVSLLRSCTGWPSGVWIDPPRRTAPDGSNFELEHWDHAFDHAFVSGPGDWRETGCAREAHNFNTPLVALVEEPHPGELPPSGSFLELDDPAHQVVLTVLKRSSNPLASGRLTGDGNEGDSGNEGYGGTVALTARLYESSGRAATVTLSAGLSWSIERAFSANLLEEPAEPVECDSGALTLRFAPAETRTLLLVLRRASTGEVVTSPAPMVAEAPATEAAQPAFSRYWLHNKGPAPMGNQLLAVHLHPTSLRMRTAGQPVSLMATVSSGAVNAEQPGNLEILAPPGWVAEPPSRLFNLAPGAHASVPVRLTHGPGAKPGRYFVAARVVDGAGQAQEDVATVDLLPVDPLGPYRADLGGSGSPAPFDHPATQIGGELEAHLSKDGLLLAPGGSDVLSLVLSNRTDAELRGEAQLVSPYETWPFTRPWAQAFAVLPAQQVEVPFFVTTPADAGPLSSWLLVKVMYFGRLWYSPAAKLEISP